MYFLHLKSTTFSLEIATSKKWNYYIQNPLLTSYCLSLLDIIVVIFEGSSAKLVNSGLDSQLQEQEFLGVWALEVPGLTKIYGQQWRKFGQCTSKSMSKMSLFWSLLAIVVVFLEGSSATNGRIWGWQAAATTRVSGSFSIASDLCN